MKEEIMQLLEAIERNHKFCLWVEKQTLESYYPNLLEESREFEQAMQKKDYENMKEELGDILWDLLMVITIAEKEGRFTAKDVITGVINKMKRRKPNIFEGRKIAIEEAKKIWHEAKANENH